MIARHPSSPESPRHPSLLLEGAITIDAAGRLKQTVLEAFAAQEEVIVDCSRATAIDLASLQLLCAAHRTAAASGRKFRISGCTEIFAKAVRDAGLQRQRACRKSPDDHLCLWLSRDCDAPVRG